MKKRILSLVLALVMCVVLAVPAFASEITPMTVLKKEYEKNDSMTTANQVNQDDTITGYISSSSDVDYFKISPTTNGVFSFWLGNIPAGKDYDLYVYDYSSGQLLASSTRQGNTQEVINGITAKAGKVYCFAVKGKNGSYSTTSAYKVRCKILMNPYTGFSQTNPEKSSTSFSITNLDKLYSSATNGSSWLYRYKQVGCFIASYAMVLRNLGAKTTVQQDDFRTGRREFLAADPFTVMLASTSWPEITPNGDGTYTANTAYNPINVSHKFIASSFGKKANGVGLRDKNLSETDKAYAIAYYLTKHPEGVMVAFAKEEGKTHTCVFTQTTVEVPSGFSPPKSNVLLSTSYDVMSESFDSMAVGTTAVAAETYGNSFTVCDPTEWSGNTYYGSPQSYGTSYTAQVYDLIEATGIYFLT